MTMSADIIPPLALSRLLRPCSAPTAEFRCAPNECFSLAGEALCRFWYALAEVEEMARSRCFKCGNHEFEMKEVEPRGSNYKFLFIQCTRCGGVVGVVNNSHLPSMLRKIGEKLGVKMDF